MSGDPTFATRADLTVWVKQRLRYPDPEPNADLRALTDIRRVVRAHEHLIGETHG